MIERVADCIYRNRTDGNKPILLLDAIHLKPSLSVLEGYWFLAELIKKGYFDLIFTTCGDNFLERILAKTMDYDDFKVIIRGEVSDETIDTLLRESHAPRVNILKLCGETRTNNKRVKSLASWEIKAPLKESLYGAVRERGFVSVGYSTAGNPLLKDLPGDSNREYWYIDVKSPTEISITHNPAGFSATGKGNGSPADDEGFTAFFVRLTKEIAEREQEENEVLKKIQEELPISKDIGDQSSICKVEVDRRRLHALMRKLKNEIQDRFPGITNFVFIDDPVAPGGIKILKRFKSGYKKWMGTKRSFKLTVSGRGNETDDRTAGRLSDENDNEICVNTVAGSERKFLLIDSVCFSGGTIKKAKNKLMEIFGDDIEVSAAVIYTGPDLEKKLKSGEFGINEANFFRIKEINSYQILFPWGWISSTVPIFTNRKRRGNQEIFNEFIPDRHFDLLPRPWGSVFSLVQNENVSVKILYVNPGEELSLHKHDVRDEIFLVLDRHVQLQIWDKKIRLERGNSFRVPAGITHRLTGLKVPCRVLEISRNYYSQVEDIERFEDKYNRVGRKGDE